MLIAFALRILLLATEGQFRFVDEHRYYRATSAVEALYQGKSQEAVSRLLRYETHPGFTAVGLIPALFHRVAWEMTAAKTQTWPEYWNSHYGDYRMSSLIFVIPSVLTIGMIYLISRQMGAKDTEALLAAFLLAASNTFFMYSQHFLPYDSSLLLALTALWLAIHGRAKSPRYAVVVGIFSFLSIWIYNGYISFVLMLAFIYCVYLAPNFRTCVLRVSGMVAGALIVFLPIYAYNLYLLEINIISQLVEFSSTVTHGEFEEGFILPIQYFAHAEGAIGVVWCVGLVLVFGGIRGIVQSQDRQRVLLWISCLLLLYAIMAVFSNVLALFVVYGRVARGMVPFIVMLCAYAFAKPFLRYALTARFLLVLVVCALAFANFVPITRLVHYRTVQRYVYENYEDVSFESTFGPESDIHGIRGKYVESARYKLLNAGVFYPVYEIVDRPAGEVILEFPHFNKIAAWQYEGMSAATRELLNESHLKMWLIDTLSQE